MFNAVGGRCAPPRQGTLMMWYVTTEPFHVSVLRVEICDLGKTEWSYQRCTSLAFGKVSISLTSCRYLTLALTSRGLLRGMGVSGYSIYLWAYKWRFSYCSSHSWLQLQIAPYFPVERVW